MSTVLLVHAKGGPPFKHTLARVAAKAEVHLLALSPLPPATARLAAELCVSISGPAGPGDDDLVELIVARARSVAADAVLTFSEYAVVAVAEACDALGLPGAGKAAALARDKRAMRRTWQQHELPQPAFRPVNSGADLAEATDSLRMPLLLKAAWSAGSTAHQIIERAQDARAAWERSARVMAESAGLGFAELHVAEAGADFVVEEIVTGTATGWFEEEAWGDYVSVEGVVADGRFHPVCLSGRLPTVEPFTERAGITPALLSDDAQTRVVELARRAVEALGLDHCGTHTEIKLGADGQMWLIETAARFGGAMTVPHIEEVYGLDLVGMLVDHLLGRPVDWPGRCLTPAEARGAAGALVVLAVDENGEAWNGSRRWDFEAVARGVRLSEGSSLTAVPESCLPEGALVPEYDPAGGANSMAALCLLSADDAPTVLRDLTGLIADLPGLLPAALGEEAAPSALPPVAPVPPVPPVPCVGGLGSPQSAGAGGEVSR